MTRPRSSTVSSSQTSSTNVMSWSTSSTPTSSAGKRTEQRAERNGFGGIEPGGGLVEHEHLRLRDERTRDPDELTLTVRQFGWPHVAPAIAARPHRVRRRRPPCSARDAVQRHRPEATTNATAPRRRGGSLARSGRRTARHPGTFGPDRRAPAGAASIRRCAGPPATRCPRGTATKPHSASIVVVFPAPFGPIRPTILPAPTCNDRSCTACNPPKLTDTSWTSSSGLTRPPPSDDPPAGPAGLALDRPWLADPIRVG